MSRQKTEPLVWDIAVIGGGAAGVFAAIHAAEQYLNNSGELANIVLIESGAKLLSKVKISGGGRCNVTHDCMAPKELLAFYPRSNRKLEGAFRQFGPSETVAWFTKRGVKLKTEPDGRIFPVTDDSQTIMDCLLGELRHYKVYIKTNTAVNSIAMGDDVVEILTNGKPIAAKRAVLATGGNQRGYPLAQQLGHQCVSPIPSLFTFELPKSSPFCELSGVTLPHISARLVWSDGLKVDGKKAKPLSQSGPLLFTHWGLSGPAVLKLSAWGARALAAVNYKITCEVDFFPEYTEDALREELLAIKACGEGRQLGNEPPTQLPKRLWQVLLSEHGIPPEHISRDCPNKLLNTFASALKRWPMPVCGKGPFKEEFVTAGGVPLNEVDLKTFISQINPAIGLAGELLNVDGVTGGFNFQHAWTSGALAGRAIASSLLAGQ
jgi:predicted Rossmann fold flavoprotein